MRVRLARPGPGGARVEPGEALPGVASFSPDEVRAASKGRPWDIQTDGDGGRSGLMCVRRQRVKLQDRRRGWVEHVVITLSAAAAVMVGVGIGIRVEQTEDQRAESVQDRTGQSGQVGSRSGQAGQVGGWAAVWAT